RRPGQAFGGWRRGTLDLLHQPSEMRGLDPVEAARAVLGRIAPGVQRLADEGALRLAAGVRDIGHGDDLINDARQFEPGLRTIDLRLEDLAIEVVEPLVEDADEPDMLAARVLQMGQPADHLAAMEPVGAPDIWLAGLLGERLGLPTAPLEAEPPGHGDRVDEDGLV